MEPPISLGQRKRIAGPFLAIRWHHIAMSGQHDAVLAIRTEARDQVGFAGKIAGQHAHPAARGGETLGCVAYKRIVGLPADRRKGDEPGQGFDT